MIASDVADGLDPSWLKMVELTFQQLGETAPVRFHFADSRTGFQTSPPKPEPGTDNPGDTEGQPYDGLAGAVADALDHGPVVVFPPWGRSADVSSPEFDWLAGITDWTRHHLGTVVPTSTLRGRHVAAMWEALPDTVRPVVALTATGLLDSVHAAFEATLIVFGAGPASPTRMFKAPRDTASNDWSADYNRLWRQQSGSTRFGYVLREAPERGMPLNYERHDPATLARTADLSSFGSLTNLGDLFEIGRTGGLVRVRDATETDASLPVVAGRDVNRDGTLSNPGQVLHDQSDDSRLFRLMAGDIVMTEIVDLARSGGLRCATVDESHLPAVAGRSLLVLRPKVDLPVGVRRFVLDFLRSPLGAQAAAVTTSTLGGHLRISARDLSGIQVPLPDAALSNALSELATATATLESWHADAVALVQGLFANPSASTARRQVLENGRHIRMRVELASRIDDFDQTVRTQYPYPVAHRWRSLDALRSGPDQDATYRAVLDAYEVLLCYAAQIAMTMARQADIELGETSKITAKLRGSRHGLGLGDWTAIIDEVSGKKFTSLPDDTPLGEIRGFIRPGTEAFDSRVRLSRLRNDQAHLRPVPSHDLPGMIEQAIRDLTVLMRQADFMVDMPLVHLAGSQWDSLTRTMTLRTRHLTGDHPVVPYRTETSKRNDFEDGSLYLADSAGEYILVRPLLIGQECPHCQTWSTFHVDQRERGGVRMKSLEHGHTITVDLDSALTAVGLL